MVSACTAKSNSTLSTSASPSPSPSATLTSSGGSRAVKIIFQQAAGGSFDVAPTGGTPSNPGSGLQATRIFNTDGTLLASGGSSSTSWPRWFSGFELGVSGTSNSASQNSGCANFANSTEGNSSNCILGTTSTCPASGSPVATKCGVPQGQFRVSEVDCALNSPVTATGNGGPNDGVYFRATFNRSTTYLASNENILVTLEYSASTLNPAPPNPTNCFLNGKFTPELCSDFAWRTYIKHTTAEVVQPYLLLVPPTFASVLGPTQAVTQTGGTMISTKQFIIPLAGDPKITVFQVSRTGSNFTGDPTVCGTPAYNLKYYCTANGAVSGSTPLCAGVVFYSMSLIRI